MKTFVITVMVVLLVGALTLGAYAGNGPGRGSGPGNGAGPGVGAGPGDGTCDGTYCDGTCDDTQPRDGSGNQRGRQR